MALALALPQLAPRVAGVRNARMPGDDRPCSLSVLPDGTIGAVGFGTAPADFHDCHSALLLPALLDGHLHPDKTLMGLPSAFVSELLGAGGLPAVTVQDRIAREISCRAAADAALSVEMRATAMLASAAAHGTLRVRAHCDVDAYIGLEQLRAVRRAADAFEGIVDVQLVAFPQSGVCGTAAGAEGVPALLREALSAGADVIGGVDPVAIDGSLDPQLEVVLGLACDAPGGADIHLHETGEVGSRTVHAICSRVSAEVSPQVPTASTTLLLVIYGSIRTECFCVLAAAEGQGRNQSRVRAGRQWRRHLRRAGGVGRRTGGGGGGDHDHRCAGAGLDPAADCRGCEGLSWER